MGHALGMAITAEGVETRKQLDILDDLACDKIQRFFIPKPLDGEQFQELLKGFKAENYRDPYVELQ